MIMLHHTPKTFSFPFLPQNEVVEVKKKLVNETFFHGYSSAITLFSLLEETNDLRLLFINLFITLCRSWLKDNQWMNHV